MITATEPATPAANGAANGTLTEKVASLDIAKEDPVENGEGDEDDEDEDEADGVTEGADKKKKKKKKKKKSKGAKGPGEPPRVGLSKVYKDGVYPVGETSEYKDDNNWRTTSEEMRHKEKLLMEEDETSAFNYNAIRRAAEVHRRVRGYARKAIRPGMTMTEIANMIEDGTRALVEEDGLKSGIGFPTGLSLNHVAAHYSPNPGDNIVLKAEDVLKVDFGVHVNGRIVDSAFTMTFDETSPYNNLLAAVQDATNSGIREAGIDVRTADLGAIIQEVMESYEVEDQGKTSPVKSIRNLTGHNIGPYHIHYGKSVPIVANSHEDETDIMEEGDYFAIETFGSTGNGFVRSEGECSHFARNKDFKAPIRLPSAKKLLGVIDRQFGTLPFCRRYLDRIGETSHLIALNNLVRTGFLADYPPLADVEGSMTAQFEHTILLRPTCKEIVSRGDDY